MSQESDDAAKLAFAAGIVAAFLRGDVDHVNQSQSRHNADPERFNEGTVLLIEFLARRVGVSDRFGGSDEMTALEVLDAIAGAVPVETKAHPPRPDR